MNATTTLFAGLGVTQVADIITWLSTWPIHSPPQNVSLAMAALVVAGAHAASDWLRTPKATPVVAEPVKPAPAAVPAAA
jgi:hypothetical protein